MKRILSLLINLIVITSLFAPVVAVAAPPPPVYPSPGLESPEEQAIEKAVKEAVQAHQADALFYQIYDIQVQQIRFNNRKDLAVAWLVPVDRSTGQVVPTEPAISVAHMGAKSLGWQVSLPTSTDYASVIDSLPQDLISSDERDALVDNAKIVPQTVAALTGYYLPWKGGQGKWISGSIGHYLIYHSCLETSCRYAYDFYDGTMFPLLASKAGTVWSYYDGTPNNDHTNVNYIVLRDPTTNPVTYQLYYHLAQGSIPAGLKKVGTVVNQGDFIGNVDNTGYSTGNHIHFMVYADPTTPGSHWGNSVDIIFSDVTVNGGRPRTCYEAKTYPSLGSQCMPGDIYYSGNRGGTPPSGELTAPAAWTTVTTPTVSVAGRGWDNKRVTNLQVVADYDGEFKPIGPLLTANPFNVNIDLCTANVPDGPFTLGLWVWDDEGTRTLLAQTPRPIVKNYTCPAVPPPCNPAADQVALYSQPNYQGACQLYAASGGINQAGIYDTASLGAVADNSAASIQVGSNVMATLYDQNYTGGAFNGRPETFDGSDAGLSDNRIGAWSVSSLKVKLGAAPAAPTLVNPPRTTTDRGLNATDSVLLTWKGNEGGVEYQVELTYPDNSKHSSPWLKATAWSVGSLPANANPYSWKVTARNRWGSATSSPVTFTIANGSLPVPPNASFPYADSMQYGVNNWTAAGLWRQASASDDPSNIFWVANQSSDGTYASSTIYASDLTSPPVAIPSGARAYLRFREYSHTESPLKFWDQRLVQISVNGGPFSDLYQMYDDPNDWWVYSPYLDLSAYAGNSIRIRFHFDQVDRANNSYPGWRVDDVTISLNAPDQTYAESTPNDSAAQATPLEMNSTTNAYICPAADVDYYSFTAVAGETVTVDIDAQALYPPSSLDTYIFLLDSDGTSVIAENDDEVSWQVRDSLLRYTLTRDGTYYLKVKSWSFPGSSVSGYTCANFFYTLKINGSSLPPQVGFTSPVWGWVGLQPLEVAVQASDPGASVAQVDFWWHSPDFAVDTWQLIGSDTDGSDGWKTTLNPAGKTIEGSILVARATNIGKLTGSTWIIPLHQDTSTPTTRLAAMPTPNNSTVIQLAWTASDTGSGISYLQIKYQDNGSAWQLWDKTFAGDVRSAYFLGLPGHTYGFTIHGIDNVGNVESYASNPETSTTIASSCNPDSYDAIVPNDSSSSSAAQLLLGETQEHNFCPAGDEDWVIFSVPAPGNYLARVNSLSGGAAASLFVTTPDGLTVLNHGHAPDLGTRTMVSFYAPAAGSYKVRVTPLNSGLWGSDMRYSLWVGKGYLYYLGKILK
jgi:hypothetical protein